MKTIQSIALILCLIPALSAQNSPPTLTLSEAIERGVSRTDLQTIFAGRSALAESNVLENQTWENPQLLVSADTIDAAGVDTQEHYLLVSQRIELFGTRKLKTQAARHQMNAVGYLNQAELLDTKALIKELFYDVLYLQQRVSILENWQAQAARVEEIVAMREEAGQISGYDRRRLSLELSEARTIIARDQASRAASWERLRTLLQLDETYSLVGTLLPPSEHEKLPLSQHPSMLAYDEEIQAASLQELAARHWKFSEITLEGGLKKTSIAGEKENGVFLSARIPLPFFNRKKSAFLHAKALGMVAQGEKALTQSKAEGHIRALQAQTIQLRAALEQFRSDAVQKSQELVSIARLAYAEGEIEILSLLDAFQSLRDAELKAVSLEAETRGLTIELERLGGVK